jgi:DNA-binding LacI/PurR family transcriptional regulator
MQSPLTGQLVHGAEAVAREQGLNFHLTRFTDDGGLPPCLDPVQVDGLIIRNTRADCDTPLPKIPTVWVFKLGYAPTAGDLVQPDNEMIGQMAANYLLERGHRSLAALTARTDHLEAQVRADRFVRFCRASGATAISLEGGSTEELVDQLLSQSPRVTGLFMPLGDNLLEYLYRALQKRNVRCGGRGADIDLISCNNDTTYVRLLDPTLPNIDIRADEIGRAAAQTLLWRIQNPHEHRRCLLIEPLLVEPVL